jgi:hypothetical protein
VPFLPKWTVVDPSNSGPAGVSHRSTGDVRLDALPGRQVVERLSDASPAGGPSRRMRSPRGQAAKRERFLGSFGLWLGFASSPSRMACPKGNHISQGGSVVASCGAGVIRIATSGAGFGGGSGVRILLDRCDLHSTGHTGGRGREGGGLGAALAGDLSSPWAEVVVLQGLSHFSLIQWAYGGCRCRVVAGR